MATARSSSNQPKKVDPSLPLSGNIVVEEANEPNAPPSYLDQAFEQATDSFAADMPWIMHGSGDVEASRVDPTAAHFLASLTAQYIAKLVDAAVDTYAMFLNQGFADQDEPLRVPPPLFRQARLPATPQPLVVREPATAPIVMKNNNQERKIPRKKPKRKMRQEYWDEPLPEPKIKSKKSKQDEAATTANQNRTRFDDNQDEHEKNDNFKTQQQQQQPLEEWVGAVGVDFHAYSIRRAHMPLGLSTPNFIFPICHDVYAYNKTRHIQAAKRGTVDPLLQDGIHLQHVLREEQGGLEGRFKLSVDGAVPPEQEQMEQDVDPPVWPDIESLLMPGFSPDWGL